MQVYRTSLVQCSEFLQAVLDRPTCLLVIKLLLLTFRAHNHLTGVDKSSKKELTLGVEISRISLSTTVLLLHECL